MRTMTLGPCLLSPFCVHFFSSDHMLFSIYYHSLRPPRIIAGWVWSSDFNTTVANWSSNRNYISPQTWRSRLANIVTVVAGGTTDANLINDWTGCLQTFVDTCDGAVLILLKWGNLTYLMSFKGLKLFTYCVGRPQQSSWSIAFIYFICYYGNVTQPVSVTQDV